MMDCDLCEDIMLPESGVKVTIDEAPFELVYCLECSEKETYICCYCQYRRPKDDTHYPIEYKGEEYFMCGNCDTATCYVCGMNKGYPEGRRAADDNNWSECCNVLDRVSLGDIKDWRCGKHDYGSNQLMVDVTTVKDEDLFMDPITKKRCRRHHGPDFEALDDYIKINKRYSDSECGRCATNFDSICYFNKIRVGKDNISKDQRSYLYLLRRQLTTASLTTSTINNSSNNRYRNRKKKEVDDVISLKRRRKMIIEDDDINPTTIVENEEDNNEEERPTKRLEVVNLMMDDDSISSPQQLSSLVSTNSTPQQQEEDGSEGKEKDEEGDIDPQNTYSSITKILSSEQLSALQGLPPSYVHKLLLMDRRINNEKKNKHYYPMITKLTDENKLEYNRLWTQRLSSFLKEDRVQKGNIIIVDAPTFCTTRETKHTLLYPWNKIHVANNRDGSELMEELCRSKEVLPMCNFYPKSVHQFLAKDIHELDGSIVAVNLDCCGTYEILKEDARLLFECDKLAEKSLLFFNYFIARVEGGPEKEKEKILKRTKEYAKENGYRLDYLDTRAYDQMFFICCVCTKNSS